MGKLKNLSLSKKYINKCQKDVFLSLIDGKNIDCKIRRIEGEEVIFLTNYPINNENILCNNRIKYHFKYSFLKHLTAIITISLCCIILFISGSFIREIKFENATLYNEQVYQDVKKHLVKKGPFYLLDNTPNNISQELRQKYPKYAWIGITVNYSEIIIDIEPQDVPIKEIEDNLKPCDLISNYDAVITGIVIKKGVVMIMLNQSVKKGELLVSGNLLIENNLFDKEKLIHSDGVIIGKTLVLEKIKVEKKGESLEYTGRIKTKKRVVLFGKDIGKNPVVFDNYYTKISEKFNLFNIFKIVEITYFEQDIITSVFDQEQAVKFAENEVYYEFEQKRVSELEAIDDVRLFEVEEQEDYFEVSFIVTKHVNIAVAKYYE